MCLLRTKLRGYQIYKLRVQLGLNLESAWYVRRYLNVRCTVIDYQGATSSNIKATRYTALQSSKNMSDCALQRNQYVSKYIYWKVVWIIPRFGDVTLPKRGVEISYSINEIKNNKLLASLFYKTTSISANNCRILENRTSFESQIVPLQSYAVNVLQYLQKTF